MASEVTVTEDQAGEGTGRGAREGGNSLTTTKMGTNCGKRQTDPGISFHPVCVSSHTTSTCRVVAANSRTKNAATPARGKELARGSKGVQDRALVHSRIFFCSRQGVIRATVRMIETLAPLLNDKPNVSGGASEVANHTDVHQPMRPI